MSTDVPFNIVHAFNGTQHDDIIVTVGDEQFVGDSYWIEHDPVIPDWTGSGTTIPSKTRIVLRFLLDQWIRRVAELADCEFVDLPFGFFDQCTDWLRVHRRADSVELTAGSSSIDGQRVQPSAIPDYFRVVHDWVPRTQTHTVPLTGFLAQLRVIRERETIPPDGHPGHDNHAAAHPPCPRCGLPLAGPNGDCLSCLKR